MKKDTFNIIIKIIMLTWVFFVIINYFWYLMNSYWSWVNEVKENKYNYENTSMPVLWWVWVAISTNIWTSLKDQIDTPVNMYWDSVEIWYILSQSKEASKKFIAYHMITVWEYFNILKTDVKRLLQSNNDRWFVLNSLIAQLEYRYTVSIKNIQELQNQRIELLNSYNLSNNSISKIKAEISTSFWNLDPNKTYENIETYLNFKKENDLARTYIIFIDKFINQYAVLNNYNKKLLDTLIINKDIILKDSFVVIPDTWSEILQDLDILQSEKEWKSQK